MAIIHHSRKRKWLKELLAKCSEGNHLVFKQMYSHENFDLSIDEVVDKMDAKKLDQATTQILRTIEKASQASQRSLEGFEDFYNYNSNE